MVHGALARVEALQQSVSARKGQNGCTAGADGRERCVPRLASHNRQRMIDGTAGAMELLIWAYAYGKPVERVEQRGPGAVRGVEQRRIEDRRSR